MFLTSVCAFRNSHPNAEITVVLPFEGPLVELLEPYCTEIIYMDMFILRRAEFGPKILVRSLEIWKLIMKARTLIAKHDLVYISTILICCFSIAARLVSRPRFVHIHEMPQGMEAKVFSRFLQYCGLHGIAISQAVADSMYKRGDPNVTIVHNGMTPPNTSAQTWARSEKLKILMIGRYLSWKGQPLLVQAIADLPLETQRKIELRFVGSAFRGQEFHLHDLQALCKSTNLSCDYSFHDFTHTAGDCYLWADLVAVPSTNPEPFGLVAIEGMAFKKAIVGAGHGGLAEIVQPGISGLLFAPRSKESLGQAILSYIQHPELLNVHGKNGFEIFQKTYTHEAYEKRFIDAIQQKIE
jgi:glycosyltransferase involved in cell wall biosynthesis